MKRNEGQKKSGGGSPENICNNENDNRCFTVSLGLLRNTELTASDKFVLITLCCLADEDNYCSATLNEIIHYSGVSRGHVVRALKKLEQLRFLKKIKGGAKDTPDGRRNGYMMFPESTPTSNH